MDEFWAGSGSNGIAEHEPSAIHLCMTWTISWELYRSFLGVLREGSLSGAARALGITQPTVGRHVAALEEALEVVLFTRSQVGLLPTEVALALRTHAEAMESTAASLQRAASGQGEGVRGVVRVSTSEVVAVEVLPPIVAKLREAHPALKVELVSTNRVQDLLRREADIAVRMPLLSRYACAPKVGPSGPKAASGVGTGEKVLVSWLRRAISTFMRPPRRHRRSAPSPAAAHCSRPRGARVGRPRSRCG